MSSQNFNDLIEQINQSAGDVQRERGTLFEKLVLAYLKNEPTYKALYQNVWLLGEVPDEYSISKKDTGVDLVAQQKKVIEWLFRPNFIPIRLVKMLLIHSLRN